MPEHGIYTDSAGHIGDSTHWQVRYKPEAGFALANGSLFGNRAP